MKITGMKLTLARIGLALVLVAGLALALAPFAHAQTIRFRHDVPNCNGFAPRTDDYLPGRYWTAPAVAMDLTYAATSVVTSYALHRVLHLPRWASAGVVFVGRNVAHVRGYERGEYPVSEHWAQVAWDWSAPALWATANLDTGSLRSRDKIIALETWAIIEAPLTCFDR